MIKSFVGVYFEKRMDMKKQIKGFTLVELLVVISIIALLLAILMPGLSKAREKAMSLVDKTRVRQWGIANTTYCNENNGRFEMGFYKKTVGGKTSSDESDTKGWTEVLYPYYKGNPEILNCPKVPVKKFQDQYTVNQYKDFIDKVEKSDSIDRTFIPWRGTTPKTKCYNVSGSYGKNAKLTSPPVDADEARSRDLMNYHTLSMVKNAATVPMFFDCFTTETFFYIQGDITDNKMTHNSGNALPAAPVVKGGGKAGNTGSTLACRAVLNRHGSNGEGITNICFVDNSTRKVYLKEMWELSWHPNYDWRLHRLVPISGTTSGWPTWMRTFKNFNK
jgi:prepilin-type N-terminal cleavage/methylation domain-containing protein